MRSLRPARTSSQLSIPTGGDVVGSGKWQAGFASVVFATVSPLFQTGGLVTWQTSFVGDDDRGDTNFLAVQPFTFWQLGSVRVDFIVILSVKV